MKIIEPVVNISSGVGGDLYNDCYLEPNSPMVDSSTVDFVFTETNRVIVAPSDYWVAQGYASGTIVYHYNGLYTGIYECQAANAIAEPSETSTIWLLVGKCASLELERGVYIRDAGFVNQQKVLVYGYAPATYYNTSSTVRMNGGVYKNNRELYATYIHNSTETILAGSTINPNYTNPEGGSVGATAGTVYVCLVTHVPADVTEHPINDPVRWKFVNESVFNPVYNEYGTWEFVGWQNYVECLSGNGSGRSYGIYSSSIYRDWRIVFNSEDQIKRFQRFGNNPVTTASQQYDRAINGIYINDMVGVDEVRCVVWDKLNNSLIKFDKTFYLDTEFTSGVTDWYSYFFKSYETQDYQDRGDDLFIEIPYSSDYEVSLEFKASSPDRRRGVGFVALGWIEDIGVVNYGTSIGIQDYSIKSTDDFGNRTIVERGYKDIVEYDITIPLKSTSYVQKLLAKNRAFPLVWLGDANTRNSKTNTLGFYKDFSIPLSDYANSYGSIEVESL